MSSSLKPLTVEEFLVWERTQESRYEFDGVQPIAMTGGTRQHARIITRLTIVLGGRVHPPCEVFGAELKVLTPGRVRYPDVSVVCSDAGDEGDTIDPAAVFEVLSPSMALTDRRVKPAEYAGVSAILVYVILAADRPEITVHRRSAGWEPETITGIAANLDLLEIGVIVPLAALYSA